MTPVTVRETVLELPRPEAAPLIEPLASALRARTHDGEVPIRLAVVRSRPHSLRCEVGLLAGLPEARAARLPPLLDVRRRETERSAEFTTVFVVPTGIGCSVGGHAGDANAAVRLLAEVSDRLVTHPNAVNASDVNELPENGLYVEGSVLARFLLGTVGLEPVRANRVLAVVERGVDPRFAEVAVNSVSAARASFGLACPEVVLLDGRVRVASEYAPSGRAAGRVEHLERLLEVLDERLGELDAIALTTRIAVPWSYHLDYYARRGEMINPWGGVEALLTHALSILYEVPAAHSPMFESREAAALDPGVVDPRMAAEVISIGFFLSVLKGLQRAPRVVPLQGPAPAGVLSVEDVSCVVLPDKALGLPTLAALEQGIPVIAVRENDNVMDNDLASLPWPPGRLHVVDNYWEAAGVVAALRAGLDPLSVRRPLADTATTVAGAAGSAERWVTGRPRVRS